VTPAPPAAWTVWFRRDSRQRWQQVGTADSEGEGWVVALKYPLTGDKCVCRPGTDPNARNR
jgi:hypothetical protein